MLHYSRAVIPEDLAQGPFQKVLEAIHSDQPEKAHRFLLQALKGDPQNIQIWLLLGCTSSSSNTAAFYFQNLLEQHPDNPLAREVIQWVNLKTSQEAIKTGTNINETKQLIGKAIAHLESTKVESQIPSKKTSQMEGKKAARPTKQQENQMVDRQRKYLEIQSTKKMATHVRIPESLRIPLAYLTALTLAESITTLAIPQIGLILHGLLLVVLILHATLFARRGLQRFLITLTLAPLIRLMSLSLPLLDFPLISWYAVIGIPLFLATFLTLRVTGFKAESIGLNGRLLPWQLVVGLTGLGFGYMEYLILQPAPLVEALTWQQVLLPAFILLLFTGFLEELIFRGLIQRGAAGTIGHHSLLYVAILFAVLHIGYHSIWDFIFVFVVALFFGLVVIRTGSILGVTLSHGLTNIALYLIIPLLMNASANPVAAIPLNATDRTTIPVVWLMTDANAKQITLSEGDLGVTHVNMQCGLIKAEADARSDWVYLKDRGILTNEKWQPGYLDYGKCRIDDYPALILATTESAHSPIWYRMMTGK
jgi:membrane protease YdiL (CAAX protease family)